MVTLDLVCEEDCSKEIKNPFIADLIEESKEESRIGEYSDSHKDWLQHKAINYSDFRHTDYHDKKK